jgi:hypothetical protein
LIDKTSSICLYVKLKALASWIETTDTASSASFLDLYLEFDDSGQINTNIYDKRDDFNFKIIDFPNMWNSANLELLIDKTSSISDC